jgi:hypothetical protein
MKDSTMRSKDSLSKQILKLWLRLVPVWIVVFVIGSWITHRLAMFGGRSISWSRAATPNFLFYSIWAFILTPAVLYLSWQFPFQLKRFHRVLPIHVSALACLTVGEAVIRVPLQRLAYSADRNVPFGRLFERTFLFDAENDLWIYCILTFVVTLVSYYKKLRREEVKSLQLEAQLTRAQLSALKMQLQPHFLFNALHSISALMHQDVRAAEKMIACLGDLLRMSIAEGEANEVSLKQELELLEKYLEIQRLRFQEQLFVEMTIDPDALTACVPYFLLQPLVENAIKHGISKRTGAGRIDIDVRRCGQQLRFRVTNDVPALDSGEINGKDGLGLGNIKLRLHTLYGAMQHLEIKPLPDHKVEVEIAIPFQLSRLPQNCTGSTGELPDDVSALRPTAS